jgi:hypothetical protein
MPPRGVKDLGMYGNLLYGNRETSISDQCCRVQVITLAEIREFIRNTGAAERSSEAGYNLPLAARHRLGYEPPPD